ncbi:hypothetical protein F5Y09DRAFT_346025 [Xylaria sp. FL1042]|nr:hypothetical protein F5Y09DRAFT_346025 [Xylaria sp. FL1042]
MEKNSQVRIMGKIYATAYRTIIFLGDQTDDSNALFEHCRYNQNIGPSTVQPVYIVSAAEQLLQRAWFSRVWPVQELMRSRDSIFMCGRDELPYDALHRFIRSVSLNIEYPAALAMKVGNFDFCLGLADTEIQKLFVLVAETGLCQSTERLDKILALTPLVQTQNPELEALVNYNQTFQELFYRFTAFISDNGCGLSFLTMIRHPHFINGLPSWVPDWGEIRNKGRLGMDFGCFFHTIEEWALRDHIDTVGNDTGFASHRLILQGYRYGLIDEQGPVIRIRQETIRDRIEDVRALANLVESIRSGTDVNALDWPTSIKGGDISALLRSRIEIKLNYETIDEPTSHNVAIGCDGAKVFITSNGKLGLCPEAAQKGDLVCIVKGAMEPCILRKTNSDWILVSGDCLLHEMELGYGLSALAREPGSGVWTWMMRGYLNKDKKLENFSIV